MKLIELNIEKLKSLCIKYKVKSLYVFGSILTSKFNANSDIDFIVDIEDNDPISYSDKYFELKFALESLFNRAIDLVEKRAIKNPEFIKEINNTKIEIYGQ